MVSSSYAILTVGLKGRGASLLGNLRIKDGSVLRVKVLKVADNGEVLLKLGSIQLKAHSTVKLHQGQGITVRALVGPEVLKLQVLKPVKNQMTLPEEGFWDSVRALLRGLKDPEQRSLVRSAFIEPEQLITEGPMALKEALQKGPISVMELIAKLLDGPGDRKARERTIAEPLKHLVQHLQWLHELASKEGIFAWVLPLWWDNLRDGKLFYVPGPQHNRGSLVLKLSFSEKGNLWAYFLLEERGISLSVFVQDRALYESLGTDRQVLLKALQDAGLRVRSVEFYNRSVPETVPGGFVEVV